ncbi:MAG: hypothetical protein RH917_18200 [Lacipirellulaceae bacterium]
MSDSREQTQDTNSVPRSTRDKFEALLARGVGEEEAMRLSGYNDYSKGALPKAPLPLWTREELLELARRSGIRNPKTLSRDELIELLGKQVSSSNPKGDSE